MQSIKLAVLALSAIAVAQRLRSVGDGVYTPEQAGRGKIAYAEQCANCHGAELHGTDETPGLMGDAFIANWRGQAVDDLFEKMRRSMPADKPGSLTRQTNADILAYILAVNKFPAGSTELGAQTEVLQGIRFQANGELRAVLASKPRAPADPAPVLEEGKPIDRRPPEMAGDKPAFPEQTRAPYHAAAPFKVTTLIDHLPAPWGLAFLPDGKILLTERLPGSLRILEKNGALSEPVAGISELASPGAKDIGLLDVVLDPHFSANHQIFFTFVDYIDNTNSNTCVARGRFDEAKAALLDAKVIFRAQPAIPTNKLGGKTGGRMAFGRDGSIFLSIGDRSDSPPWDVAQRLDNHLGKIVHITADGAPAPDNPFIGRAGVLPEIWAYGNRNQEGLAFDPATGRLWENEHGPRGGDDCIGPIAVRSRQSLELPT